MSNQIQDPSLEETKNSLLFPQEDEDDDLLNELDIAKLLVIAQKSLPWILIIFIVSFSGAFIYFRYTKPVFESSSILKLDLKKDAGVLGFKEFNNEGIQASKISTLSGEIELIKSRITYKRLIERMNLKVSYYSYGNILFDEKYKESPFELKDIEIRNKDFYDVPIDLTILNYKEYLLGYKILDKEIQEKHSFGENVQNNYFQFRIFLTTFYNEEAYRNVPFFFKVNSNDALINYLMKNVSVEIFNLDANTIKVSFKDNNKVKAADVVNMIDTVYLEQTIEDKSKAHEQTLRFLESSLVKTETNLEDAEKQLEAFVRSNKTVDVKEDFSKVTEEIQEIDKAKLDLRLKISLLNDLTELISTDKDLKVFLPSVSDIEDAQLATAINNLNQLQAEREILAASYEPTTFALRSKDKIIENLKKSIFELISQNKKLLYQQINELNRKMVELETHVLSLPAKETEFTRLKRFYNLYEKFYLLLMEKETEFGIAKAGTIPNFMILSPGQVNSVPIFPNKQFLYLIAFGLGFSISVILVFLRYFLHDSIATQKELERNLRAPLVGGVPVYTKEKMEVSRLIVDKNPKSAISEAIRSIRTNLEFICPGKKKKLITVTSTVSGEGKTFVAVNLGGVIAMSNLKVVILDLDMRKPKVHYAFDKENFKGMSTILIGKHTVEECINRSSIDNLFFITAGPTPPNPSELILNPEFDRVLEELFEKFDVVMIDTPPVGLVTDGILIMKKADIPLYVVRANYSKKGVKKNINKLVRTTGLNKLCVILNALKAINTYGYGGYGYGYGYGYYEGDDQKKSFLKRIFSLGK